MFKLIQGENNVPGNPNLENSEDGEGELISKSDIIIFLYGFS